MCRRERKIILKEGRTSTTELRGVNKHERGENKQEREEIEHESRKEPRG